jgi:superfamily I DNA and/or RNA helicase
MSAFERLYRPADDGHQDMLLTQRRMPPEIGEFVSKAFYNGRLKTIHPGAGTDPVFGPTPFVMIDTGDRPAGERAERKGRRREDWNQHGYVNELEATLITELMRVYATWYKNWAVIVPYRAQVELVQQRLAAALADGGRTAEQVGTVDSFQGGERDLIIYGFTRSNTARDIGFLRELRRLNVAISRAKQQLVLVGDLDTLSRATDRPFADLIRAMATYLGTAGRRESREVEAVLAARAGIRP